MKFKLSFSNPLTHFIEVEAHLHQSDTQTRLKFPRWRPGRYQLTTFPARIRNFQVWADDKEIGFHKVSPSVWEIHNDEVANLRITYRYYAHQFDAGGSVVNEELIYLNPINFLPFTDSNRDALQEVTFQYPENWSMISSRAEDEAYLEFDDYDRLVDTPLIACPDDRLFRRNYEVQDSSFEMVFIGDDLDVPDFAVEDFRKFTAEMVSRLDGFPASRYYFLIFALPNTFYHGVEHQDSTVITLGPAGEMFSGRYNDLLGVSAHELFHAWNVCRLRPSYFYRPDFSQEMYFDTGWVLEGLTAYYGDLMLARAGVFSHHEYVNEINRLLRINGVFPGFEDFAPSDASVDLWMDGYDQPAPWKKPSIYIRGALIWLLIHIHLYRQGKSLDELFMTLYRTFFQEGQGYDMQSLRAILKKYEVESVLDRYVLGSDSELTEKILEFFTEELNLAMYPYIPFDDFTTHTGIRLDGKKVKMIADQSPAQEVVAVGDEIHSYSLEVDKAKLSLTREGKGQKCHFRLDDKKYWVLNFLEVKANASQQALTDWLSA